jgi:hypothetical protein
MSVAAAVDNNSNAPAAERVFVNAVYDAARALDAPRLRTLFAQTPAMYANTRFSSTTLDWMLDGIQAEQAQHRRPTADGTQRFLACMDLVGSVVKANPTRPISEFGPSPLVLLLNKAQNDTNRDWRPVWALAFCRIVASTSHDDARLARAQWWLVHSPPARITPAELRGRPQAALEGIFWGRREGLIPPAQTVEAKLQSAVAAFGRSLDPAIADTLLVYALAYAVRREHKLIEARKTPVQRILAAQTLLLRTQDDDDERCVSILRLTITGLGADPVVTAREDHLADNMCAALQNLRTAFFRIYAMHEQWAFWTSNYTYSSSCDRAKTEQKSAELTPIYRLLRTADDDARQRALAVAMALHPRLGANSLLSLVEVQFFRELFGPAARRSVTLPPPTAYEHALRRRLRAEANIDVFRIKQHNGPLLKLFDACVRKRSKLTAPLLARFRVRAWRSEDMRRELGRKAFALRDHAVGLPKGAWLRALRKCVRARGPPKRA